MEECISVELMSKGDEWESGLRGNEWKNELISKREWIREWIKRGWMNGLVTKCISVKRGWMGEWMG